MEALRIACNSMKAAEKVLASQGYILRWKVTVESSTGFLRETEDAGQVQKIIPESKTSTVQPQDAVQTSKHKQATEEIQPVTALSLTDAVSYLGMTKAGIYDLIKRNRIPVHGEMGKRWFLTEELDQYLESRKRPATIRNTRPMPVKQAKGARG